MKVKTNTVITFRVWMLTDKNKWEGKLSISDTIFKINDILGKPQ